jgi:hypothetical protein
MIENFNFHIFSMPCLFVEICGINIVWFTNLHVYIFFIVVISIHQILCLYHNIWMKLLKWKIWIWWQKSKMVAMALVFHELMSINVCIIHKSQALAQRRKPLIHVLSLVYWRFEFAWRLATRRDSIIGS